MANIQWSFFWMKYIDIQPFIKQNGHFGVIRRLGLRMISKNHAKTLQKWLQSPTVSCTISSLPISPAAMEKWMMPSTTWTWRTIDDVVLFQDVVEFTASRVHKKNRQMTDYQSPGGSSYCVPRWSDSDWCKMGCSVVFFRCLCFWLLHRRGRRCSSGG